MDYVLDSLAKMAAKHKIVPFIGAGCSIPHLSYGWDSLVAEMKNEINSSYSDHLEVAQEFINKRGKKGLCEFLKEKLLIDKFEDKKGFTHIAIMSLGIKLIYTTNQDNVMEKCFEKYGREYRKIVTLDDLAQSVPGENLYIKFHGDLFYEESVVFTQKDYENRMINDDCFLDIRLRSDLLGKSLLFIGYSFRDDNIRKIFEEINSSFKGKLPPSYLIAYSYSKELHDVCSKYNVKLVNPQDYFPKCDNREAFEKFLYELVEKTFTYKTHQQIDDMFHPKIPPTQRVISAFELKILKEIVSKENFSESLDKFRALLDQTSIPLDFEKDVAELFFTLCRNCSTSQDVVKLNGAAFNMLIKNRSIRFEILAHLMAIGNVREKNRGFDIYLPKIKGIPRELYIIAVARAIELLNEWGRKVTEQFRSYVISWVDSSMNFEEMPLDVQQYVKRNIDWAWKEYTTYEYPLKRQQRLKDFPLFKSRSSYEEILNDMLNMMPKRFNSPYEE